MRRSLKGLTFTAVGAAALAYATSASAITIDVISVTGIWTDATPAAAVTGVGFPTISWGTGSGGPSSYNFTGAAPPPLTGFNVGDVFSIGTFTHDNNPISPPSLQTAELTVDWSIEINNGSTLAISGQTVYDFNHNETPNTPGTCPDGSVSICDDIVTFTLNPEETDVFTYEGEQYIFTISSFLVDGSPATDFLTQEGKKNTAVLQGSVNVVPVPAAVWLLGSAVAGLGAAGWRRRKAA